MPGIHDIAPEHATIHVALAAAKEAVGAVSKSQRNTAQNFNFRGVDAVVNAAAPALNKFGVIVVPQLIDYTYDTVEVGAKRTPMAHVIARVAYSFYGPAGDHVQAVVFSEAMDSGDKCVAKAMSVAYRIALLQVLNLPTDEPDPDSVSYERAPKRSAQDFVTDAAAAKTRDELLAVFKAAGAAGTLNEQVAAPDGEKMTLSEYFGKRGDEINLKSGDGGAKPAAASGKTAGK